MRRLRLLVSERKQMVLMAEEKLPAQLVIRLFASSCPDMEII